MSTSNKKVSEQVPAKTRKKRGKAKKVFAKKVVLSKDGKSFSFSSIKQTKLLNGRRFRQNPELEAFYRFVHENNLRAEVYDILFQLVAKRRKDSPKGRKSKAK